MPARIMGTRSMIWRRSVAVGALGLIAGCGDGPTPPFTDPRGLLLVVRGIGASAEILAMRPDGADQRQLTNNSVWDGDPDWSPDGRRIVFVSQVDSNPGAPVRRPDIYVMNADGTGKRRLLQVEHAAWHPRWSPDGRRIAFEQWFPDVGMGLYVMNSDGSGVQLLPAGPAENFSPEWSPDGTRLLFLSNRAPRSWWTMHVMRADGTDERQLAGDQACLYNVFGPRWSPDGSLLAYACDNGIYAIDAAGTGRTLLTSAASDGVWSPDGSQLAFTSERDVARHVYVKELASGAVSRVTRDDAGYFAADWGPRGR